MLNTFESRFLLYSIFEIMQIPKEKEKSKLQKGWVWERKNRTLNQTLRK